jgi:hypothetical protein
MGRPAIPPGSTLSQAAQSAWGALARALDVAVPSCAGDSRFIAETHHPHDLAAMQTVCASCPILAECAAFADVSPRWSMAGFWAGSKRGVVTRTSGSREGARGVA